MASKKITAMPDLAGAQVSTDLTTLVDLSVAPAVQNVKSTLNDLFAYLTKNITDKAVRFQGAAAPAVSGANEGAIYYDLAANEFKLSQNGGAYVDLYNPLAVAGVTGSVQINNGGGLLDGDGQFIYDPLTATVTIGSSTLTGHLRLRAITSGNGVTLEVDAPAGNHTYIWPNALPTTTGQALTATGISGSTITLGWQAAGTSGSGTTGALAKWTAATTLGDSIITESGTTVTIAGQAIVNQAATATVGFTVQAVAAATAELVQIKDSAGSVRGGYSTAGALFFRGFSSAPTNSLANDGKLYYDIGGGGLTQQLLLSKNTAVYNPVIVANQSSHINNRMARWSTTSWELNIGNVSDNDVTFSIAELPASSGSARYFQVLTPASTGQTATTEAVGIQLGGNSSLATVTRQWATGTITTQREVRFIPPTYAFVGASTISNAIGVEISSPIEGTNATFTIAQALRLTPSANAHLGLVVEHLSGATGDLLRLNLNTLPIIRFAPVSGDVNSVFGDSALGTTATDGFIHYPSMAGVPTGVPTAYTGVVPTVVDTTNSRFYAYIGAAWVNLSGSGSITGSGAAGRAAFWTGASALSSNANYQWDDVNSRLSINQGASPAAPVHVKADASNLAYRVTANAAAIDVDFSSDGSIGFIGTTTTHGFELWTDATTRIRIEAGGSVGINQAAPGAQLDVVAGAAGTVGLIISSAATPSVNIVTIRQNATNVFQITSAGAIVHETAGLTTGNGASFTSSTVSSGNVVSITATGTAAASNTKTALNVATSGANGTGSQTTYAIRAANTSTGSGTNVAGYFTASGGTNNYSVQLAAGRMIGDNSTPFLELSSGNGSILGYSTNSQFVAGGAARVDISGTPVMQWASTGANLAPLGLLSWAGSGSASGAADTYIGRGGAAASVRLGQVDAASPVAQTLSVQNVVGGTSNTAGAAWTHNGSRGTGTGTGGAIIWQVAPAGSTGTTQNALIEALRITGESLVGIRISSPSAQLHVVSGAAGTTAARFEGTGTPSANIFEARLTSGSSVFLAATQRETLYLAPIATVSSPTNGDVWSDSSRNTLASRIAGQNLFFSSCIFRAIDDKLVDNTTTETTLLAASVVGTATIAANHFQPGKVVKLRARGYWNTDAGNSSFNIRFKIGGVTIATGAINATASMTTLPWDVEIEATCRTTGVTGTIMIAGSFNNIQDGTTRAAYKWDMNAGAAGTVDTTGALTVDLTAQMGTATADNYIVCTSLVIELVG